MAIPGDFASWSVAKLADAISVRLVRFVLGPEQERALRQAAKLAVQAVSRDMWPDDAGRAAELEAVINHLFERPVPAVPMAGYPGLIAAIQAGIWDQLEPLGNADLTEQGVSSADVLGIPLRELASRLFWRLRENILGDGLLGGPLKPVADQINHEETRRELGFLADIERQIGRIQAGPLRDNGKSLEQQRNQRRQERESIFMQRAKGLDSSEPGTRLPDWRFTGRHVALRELAQWIHHIDTDYSVRIVTGRPGTGKTALIGRLVLLADPVGRQAIPELNQLPDDTLPPVGLPGLTEPIHAGGKTVDEIVSGISDIAGVPANDWPTLVSALGERLVVVVIDGIDEASDPEALARDLILPPIQELGRNGARRGLRLLLGMRRIIPAAGHHERLSARRRATRWPGRTR